MWNSTSSSGMHSRRATSYSPGHGFFMLRRRWIYISESSFSRVSLSLLNAVPVILIFDIVAGTGLRVGESSVSLEKKTEPFTVC